MADRNRAHRDGVQALRDAIDAAEKGEYAQASALAEQAWGAFRLADGLVQFQGLRKGPKGHTVLKEQMLSPENRSKKNLRIAEKTAKARGGSELAAAAREAKMSLRELASRIPYSYSNISEFGSGKKQPPRWIAEKIRELTKSEKYPNGFTNWPSGIKEDG